jgi:hypothetical protein
MATETERCETITSKEVGKHKLSLLKRKGEEGECFIVSHLYEQTRLSSFDFAGIGSRVEATACFYALLTTIENVLRCENKKEEAPKSFGRVVETDRGPVWWDMYD